MRLLLTKVLVRDTKTNKYLILRSGVWPENPHRSLKPDLPGGTVDPGETVLEGMMRELTEETGISVDPASLRLVMEVEGEHQGKYFLRSMYFCEIKSPKVVLSWEHDKYWWMSAQEVLALDIREPYPEFFQKLYKDKLLR